MAIHIEPGDDQVPADEARRAFALEMAIHVLGPGAGRGKIYVDCATEFENYVRGLASVPATKLNVVKID